MSTATPDATTARAEKRLVELTQQRAERKDADDLPRSMTQRELNAYPAEKADRGKPFIQTPTPLREWVAQFSPNGRWVAYQSNESGRAEVYVQAYPPSGGKWQISTTGGQWPVWRGDGKEIIYTTADDTLHAVPVSMTGGDPTPGNPVRLFQRRVNRIGNGARRRWVVSRDGQRFLLNVPVEDQDVTGATVVLGWAVGLDKK